jgi:osomolarity two-component system, sensor histidine kinase CHK1
LTIDPLLYIGATLTADAATEENMLRGFAYGRLAIRIIETQAAPAEVACSVYNFFASHILIWHSPLVETQRYFLAAIKRGLETYNIMWTSAPVMNRAVFGFFAGESLDLVQAKLEEAQPLIRKGKQETGKHCLSTSMQLVQSLRGVETSDDSGTESPLDPKRALSKAQINQLHTHLFTYHCYQLVLAVFHGLTDIGMAAVKACEMYVAGATSSFLTGMYTFYSAVLFVDNNDNLMPSELMSLQKKIDIIRLWSKTSPSTFEHKYKFLRVMASRRDKNQLGLLDAFDDAIHLAVEAGLIHDAALYAERCSRWLAESSPNRSAQYLDFARRQYDFWGATVKVNEISLIQPSSTVLRGFCKSAPVLN